MPELTTDGVKTPPPPSSGSSSEAPLARYIHKNLIRAGLSLVLLAVIAGVLAVRYGEELDRVTDWVFDTIGLGGLVLLIFITDWFVSPFPPDSVLLLIANSPYHPDWLWLIPTIGTVSSIAGWLGYFCGRRLSRTKWPHLLFGRIKQNSPGMILRYGPWAVALGAMTPIPFSITCWTAGMLDLPFGRVVWPCLLRIPRYVIYYVAIAYAEVFAQKFF